MSNDALAAYRAWLLRAYRRFIAALSAILAASKTPVAMRVASLDSLLVLAALEARHARTGKLAHPDALDAANGAYRCALDALAYSKQPVQPTR